jgi:hypothetical protein
VSTVSRAQLRQQFYTLLDALPGWRPSPFVPERFGNDPESLMGHGKFFAVLTGRTADTRAYRGRPAEGLDCETEVTLIWAYRIRPKDQLVALDEAEAAGQELVNAAMRYDAGWPGDLSVRLVDITREVLDSGEWIVGRALLSVIHTLPLA